ncbi:MAG TPA: OsmC family protein [Chitinolyticbacter sp.]|nr:OsmC family protein [Chitinolyticbacter sp.]
MSETHQIGVTVSAADNGYLRIQARDAVTHMGRAPAGSDAADAFRAGELLLGALAACTAGTVRGYARNHGIALADVRIEATGIEVAAPSRIAEIHLDIVLEGELDDGQRQRLLAAARACKLHRTLTQGPQITLGLASQSAAAAATA